MPHSCRCAVERDGSWGMLARPGPRGTACMCMCGPAYAAGCRHSGRAKLMFPQASQHGMGGSVRQGKACLSGCASREYCYV